MEKTWTTLLGCALICAICLIVGFSENRSAQDPVDTSQHLKPPADAGHFLSTRVRASQIDSYLRHLSKKPRLAGSAQDWETAAWIRDHWIDDGLDSVQILPYDVLLSYPDAEKPNKVYLVDQNGTVVYETAGKQTPLRTEEEFTIPVVNNFLAYSANGTVEGNLIYVHYGRVEDFDLLQTMGINVSGSIVMARYGKVFRGSIVQNAEKRGAIGVILFSDPQDYATRGRTKVYPDSLDMPGMAVQSGSTKIHRGDPLTPGWPAKDNAFRLKEKEVNLPQIVVQPIGYDEAEVLIRSLAVGQPLPEGWQGGLDVEYQTGPGFREDGWKVRLEVRTTNQRAKVYNVIGTIHGAVEPDRYVIVGSHSDSWAFGAVDCGSGMATLMETVRVTGQLKRTGWRPRRTLIFAAWAAEEYGLIGSIEWVEQFQQILNQRAVVYINADPGVIVNELFIPRGVPSLHRLVRRIAKSMPNFDEQEIASGRPTLYDTWLRYLPDPNEPDQPLVRGMGSGSDFHGFLYFAGVSSVDFSFRHRNSTVGGYPLYHTMYDTYYALATFGDPALKAHVALTRFRIEVMRVMADEAILPFDLSTYVRFLQRGFGQVQDRYRHLLDRHGIVTGHVEEAIDQLVKSVSEFVKTLDAVDVTDLQAVRRVNDQLMYFERFFIVPTGLPLVSNADHFFLSPNPNNLYANLQFAPIVNMAESLAEPSASEGQLQEKIEQLQQHLSVISFKIEEAALSLRSDTQLIL